MDAQNPLNTDGWNKIYKSTELANADMHAIARPNNDTLYQIAMLDLRDEPVILTFLHSTHGMLRWKPPLTMVISTSLALGGASTDEYTPLVHARFARLCLRVTFCRHAALLLC